MHLINLHKIQKSFRKADGQKVLVLDDIDFTMEAGEIVAMLGKSGSGKSTLLRIIAGLTPPSAGKAYFRGLPIQAPMPGMSMVFQHFALFPWLTVLGNVELGLEAQGVMRTERRRRALEAIDTIGLDGFESAYPQELSGGMRQRVGIARALVVEPELLLMDEAFSALDVLTAENLKTDLLDLWWEKRTHIQGILMITHNIEEAVIMADRVVVFGGDPGTIRSEISIDLPHPRSTEDPKVHRWVEKIYHMMIVSQNQDTHVRRATHLEITLGYRLPDIEISELTGLIESLAFSKGSQPPDMAELAESLHLDVDDLLPLCEMLDVLRFVTLSAQGIRPTPAGKQFAHADILEKKNIFAQHLLQYIPLARYVRHILDARPWHKASKARILSELESEFTASEAERVFKTIVDWGRYAEIFAYDSNSETLSLENPG